MKTAALILTFAAALICGCQTAHDVGADLQRSALDQLKRRSVKREFAAAVKSGSVAFYAIGSLLDGYSLPGLTKDEAALVERESLKIVTEFATDPAPLGATKEYWDAAESFAAAYNRMVYGYYAEKKPNQTPEPTPLAVTPRADARVAPSSVVAHL